MSHSPSGQTLDLLAPIDAITHYLETQESLQYSIPLRFHTDHGPFLGLTSAPGESAGIIPPSMSADEWPGLYTAVSAGGSMPLGVRFGRGGPPTGLQLRAELHLRYAPSGDEITDTAVRAELSEQDRLTFEPSTTPSAISNAVNSLRAGSRRPRGGDGDTFRLRRMGNETSGVYGWWWGMCDLEGMITKDGAVVMKDVLLQASVQLKTQVPERAEIEAAPLDGVMRDLARYRLLDDLTDVGVEENLSRDMRDLDWD